MAQLSILTLNVQGCRDSLKRYEIINFIKHTNNQIICLQDTHTINDDESSWRLIWGGPIFFSHLSTRRGGVIVAVSKNTDFDLVHFEEIIQGRISHLKLKAYGKIYHIINIYASPDNSERITNFQVLDKLLYTMKTESVFVCGDFNVTLDPTLDRSGDRESHPESQRTLQLLILEHSLRL